MEAVIIAALVTSAAMQVKAGQMQAEAIGQDARTQAAFALANAEHQSIKMKMDQSARNIESANLALDNVKKLRSIIASNEASASARGVSLGGTTQRLNEVSQTEANRQLSLIRTGQSLSRIRTEMERGAMMTSSQAKASSIMASGAIRSQATLMGSYGQALGTLAVAGGMYTPAPPSTVSPSQTVTVTKAH